MVYGGGGQSEFTSFSSASSISMFFVETVAEALVPKGLIVWPTNAGAQLSLLPS